MTATDPAAPALAASALAAPAAPAAPDPGAPDALAAPAATAPAAPGTPAAAPAATAQTSTAPPAPRVATAARFPIVGIGASAGGLAAFEAFFAGMPAATDPDMAFVLVQHLAPDHKSILTDLIQRYTRMQVAEVEDGMVVRPNCAYIIPPNHDMAFLNGRLQLLAPSAPRGQRLPIDFFFRSLAQDQREHAIGIILSGTGSDGTLGVRAIKGEGGMVMAQNPASTEYDGMPRSALATGLVDYELPPAEMPAQLIAYVTQAFGKLTRLPPPTPTAENALRKILVLLRAQSGHDFAQYKRSTVARRLERRLAIHQIDTLDHYVQYVQQTPSELEALFHDLLIGVTQFFRDPAAFQALEQRIIPQLFADKAAAAVIRVWSVGCATGEEAYSLAILLAERQEVLKQTFRVQVFATDIDSHAIATARLGLYPASIAADLTPERLARFFTVEADGSAYRIHKSIRDLVIFSEQDLIRDPPFSKLDLISCRNLLIYLNGELQKRLMPLFHYALNPGGYLFLGTSETVGEGTDRLFTLQDRPQRLYRREAAMVDAQRGTVGQLAPPLTAGGALVPSAALVLNQSPPRQPPLRELTEQALLQAVVPAAALVNGQGDILYLHGRTGQYLEPAPGAVGVINILKMAREGLRQELTRALHQVGLTQAPVRHPGLRVKTNGDFAPVTLTVRPVAVAAPSPPLYLVTLEVTPPLEPPLAAIALDATAPDPVPTDAAACIAALQQELRAKEEYLQATHEELETANEELQSANEEMQSVNEELQSTNEELETSKEELQSVNEELSTVNAELQSKVISLSRANNDLSNLLAGTGIGTVFVDPQLRILRYTPAVTAMINLIPSDVGRPVAHVVTNLVGYDQLVADTQAVLDSLVPTQREVRTTAGAWYMLRILPYRTLENVIEGAVLTFVDITATVQAREGLRQAHDLSRLAVVVRDAHDAITVQDLEGRIIAWNPGAVRLYGWSEAEALALNDRDRIPAALGADHLARLVRLSRAETLEPEVTQRLHKTGQPVEVTLTATALLDPAGHLYGIATTERGRGLLPGPFGSQGDSAPGTSP